MLSATERQHICYFSSKRNNSSPPHPASFSAFVNNAAAHPDDQIRKPGPVWRLPSHFPKRDVLSVSPEIFCRLSLSSPSDLGRACPCQKVIVISTKTGAAGVSAPRAPAPRAFLWPPRLRWDAPPLFILTHSIFRNRPESHRSPHPTYTHAYVCIT